MENNSERKILELFLFSKKLKFNEIEKKMEIRSNKLSYHLKSLLKKNYLFKTNDNYSLTEVSELFIPYLTEKKAVLPVLLIHIGDSKNAFLYKREKRPYENCLSLPGGRLVIGESLNETVKRIMKEKFNLRARLKKINSISLEHATKANKKIHSFLLIFVSADTKDKIKLVNIYKNKKNIIPSDYYLIKNNLNKNAALETIFTKIKK